MSTLLEEIGRSAAPSTRCAHDVKNPDKPWPRNRQRTIAADLPVVATLAISKTKELRVHAGKLHGRQSVAVVMWARFGREWCYTNRGVSIEVSREAELRAAIKEAAAELRSQGKGAPR